MQTAVIQDRQSRIHQNKWQIIITHKKHDYEKSNQDTVRSSDSALRITETIVGEQSGTNASTSTQGATFVTTSNGVGVSNPGAKHFDIEFVEAVGNTAGNTVTIIVKATSKDLNYSNVHIGDNNVTAYDADGNEYKSTTGSPTKNLTVGIPVKFEWSKLINVPATVSVLPVVYTTYYVNADIRSRSGTLSTYIQLKNVPIKWQ